MDKVDSNKIREKNKDLITIWKRDLGKVTYEINPSGNSESKILVNALVPKFFKDIYKKNVEVLFIGLNPSFSEKGFSQIVDGSKMTSGIIGNLKTGIATKTKSNISLKQVEMFGVNFSFSEYADISKIKPIQDLDRQGDQFINEEDKGHPYHKTLLDFAKDFLKIGDSYEQLDLINIRGTDSKAVKKLWSKSQEGKIKKFISDQIELTIDMIKLIDPKMIVVLNAKSEDLLKNGIQKRIRPKQDDFDTKIYVERFKESEPFHFFPELKDKPIVLWSQLSGGTTSIGQKEVLAYVIRQKLDEINKAISTSSVEKYNL